MLDPSSALEMIFKMHIYFLIKKKKSLILISCIYCIKCGKCVFPLHAISSRLQEGNGY